MSSDNIPGMGGIQSFRGYVFSDQAFTVNIFQSQDGVNFDFKSTFASGVSGANQQCGFMVERLAEHCKFEIVCGAVDMTVLRGYLNGL
jgi:hypothetical protein